MKPMKSGANYLKNAMAMSLMAGLAMAWRVDATPPAPVAPKPITRSIFNLPSNSKEGRDPFFPNSTRPYENAVAALPQKADVSSLVLRGFSGPPDHRFVIINNHTFGVGDEEDVITSEGRIHVRCLEIKGNTVTIEINGERHELSYSANP
jgi:hypothetical protein